MNEIDRHRNNLQRNTLYLSEIPPESFESPLFSEKVRFSPTATRELPVRYRPGRRHNSSRA